EAGVLLETERRRQADVGDMGVAARVPLAELQVPVAADVPLVAAEPLLLPVPLRADAPEVYLFRSPAGLDRDAVDRARRQCEEAGQGKRGSSELFVLHRFPPKRGSIIAEWPNTCTRCGASARRCRRSAPSSRTSRSISFPAPRSAC